jgi:hypothetical protein
MTIPLLLVSFATWSQISRPSNSFDSTYKQTNPTLKYSYDDNNQIHDYSNNWDFDMDGANDDLLFIGNGGTHLYYYLRIVLSSDKIVRDYKCIELDFPLLPNNRELENINLLQSPFQFVILDSDKDGLKDIYIHMDYQSMIDNSKQLRRYKIYSTVILITFKNKKVKLNNYPV